ncbi:hypothetical protein ILYODFUR_031342 [Ilyodon furcidens]|uniref:Uncharacterized protein n=1 Tax=Ilyodon furcidens TaxID=33524 RepID=A0ABV0TDV6_9TELE
MTKCLFELFNMQVSSSGSDTGLTLLDRIYVFIADTDCDPSASQRFISAGMCQQLTLLMQKEVFSVIYNCRCVFSQLCCCIRMGVKLVKRKRRPYSALIAEGSK